MSTPPQTPTPSGTAPSPAPHGASDPPVLDSGLRVLLLENIHSDASAHLRAEGHHVETESGALDDAALLERLPGVNVLGIRSRTQITDDVLEHAPDLLAVGAFCIGINQIDLPATTRRGIAAFNAPFSNTRSVVELVLSQIISLTRRLTDKSSAMHAGVWDKSATGSHEVRGRRLGIVGYGNIGSQLSVLAEALGLSVYFYDTADKLALGNARRCDSLEELLQSVDIVTLHVDGRPGNSGLFGETEFAQMRDGAIFLNLSRGFVVDHAALRSHLESGHLTGASIDVFPQEPKSRGEEFVSELRGLPNVILTPHIGGSTEEAQQDIGGFVSAKLANFISEGDTSLSVNLPALNLPERNGAHRLLHIHRNTPGVLAALNGVLADHGVNVEGQTLGTRGEVGYAITDTGGEMDSTVMDAVNKMSETIRVRLLS
ncbi:MAG: phosphoglycerate dehydrogenase [Streptosporangiaceae bacterium]